MVLRRVLQALGQVQQVGQAPLAVGPCEQPRHHAFVAHPAPQHHADAVAPPSVAVAREARHDVEQPVVVGGHGVERRRVQPHQVGGQRGAQQPLARGLEHRGQQALEFVRVGAGVDAGLRMFHTAHAQRRQRLPHLRPLGMAAHQHGDVARRQRPGVGPLADLRLADLRRAGLPLADLHLATLRRRQQPRDLARAGAHRGRARLALGQRHAARLRQHPQLQRRAAVQRRRAAVDQRRAPPRPARDARGTPARAARTRAGWRRTARSARAAVRPTSAGSAAACAARARRRALAGRCAGRRGGSCRSPAWGRPARASNAASPPARAPTCARSPRCSSAAGTKP